MKTVEAAKVVLDSMLGHLGFVAQISIESNPEGESLQIHSSDRDLIIGNDGEHLEDLQYLVNRVLKQKLTNPERIRIDCEHFRSIQEDELKQNIDSTVERLLETKKAAVLSPMNAYYRRLVYQFLLAYPQVKAQSPDGDSRLKRITISIK